MKLTGTDVRAQTDILNEIHVDRRTNTKHSDTDLLNEIHRDGREHETHT